MSEAEPDRGQVGGLPECVRRCVGALCEQSRDPVGMMDREIEADDPSVARSDHDDPS